MCPLIHPLPTQALLDTLGRAASLTAQLLDPRHRAHGGAEPPAHSTSFSSPHHPSSPQQAGATSSPAKLQQHLPPTAPVQRMERDVETGHGPEVPDGRWDRREGHDQGHDSKQHGGRQLGPSSSLPHGDLDAELHAAVAASAAAAGGGDTLAALRAALHELDLRRLRVNGVGWISGCHERGGSRQGVGGVQDGPEAAAGGLGRGRPRGLKPGWPPRVGRG